MLVLGIESSCDDTGLALFDSSAGLLGHVIHSQIELHQQFGGIVPELASRDHVRRLRPLLNRLLEQTGRHLDDIDAVAYTSGPGLVGALLTGATFGRTLAWARNIPALGVHHMEGHLLSPLLVEQVPQAQADDDPASTNVSGSSARSNPIFPFVALLVSGGHTQLYRVTGIGGYELLGESLDDAAGEAFDKSAKLLGLPYPGGPAIAKMAGSGDPHKFPLPRPMLNRPGLDFSFSGLKTAVRLLVERQSAQGPIAPETVADIAASVQEAIVATLSAKCERALTQTGLDRLIVAGGVSANLELRQRLDSLPAVDVSYPPLNLCTDNGAMIAQAGCFRLLAGERSGLEIVARPRWPLDELTTVSPQTPEPALRPDPR